MHRILYYLGLFFVTQISAQDSKQLRGSWELQQDSLLHLVLVSSQYYTYTVFSESSKTFVHTEGGRWRTFAESPVVETITEFNASDITQVKEKAIDTFFLKKFHKGVAQPFDISRWKHSSNGSGPLDANWRISEREQNGSMQTIPEGSRKTIKILVGTWFQWAAINTATGEFFGTGGGTFSYSPGSYTETIRFFSRNNSKVGIKLEFSDTISNGKWDHRGKSSKGDPIHEIWIKTD